MLKDEIKKVQKKQKQSQPMLTFLTYDLSH
jgi:hypothetical protein